MRFGFFDQLPCPPGFTEQQRYNDIIAQIELGDAVGFDTVWLGDLHFSRGFSTLADPLITTGRRSMKAECRGSMPGPVIRVRAWMRGRSRGASRNVSLQ